MYYVIGIIAAGFVMLDLFRDSISCSTVACMGVALGVLVKLVINEIKKKTKEKVESTYATAVHEAGHTIVQLILLPTRKINKVTIIPENNDDGFIDYVEDEGQPNTIERIKADIQIDYAGRISEQIILGNMYEGSRDDFKEATKKIDELFFKEMGEPRKNILYCINDTYSNMLREKHFQDIHEISMELYQKTEILVQNNKDLIKKLTDLLYEKKWLSEEEINKFVKENEDYF